MDEIDSLDTENKHYKKIKSDLDYRLYRMYDKIEEIESNILDARTKKEVLQANKLTGDNIYKVLIYFDKLFKLMDERERRKLITSLVESIQVFEKNNLMVSGLNQSSLNFQSLKKIWKLVGKKGACGDYSVATKGQYLKIPHW